MVRAGAVDKILGARIAELRKAAGVNQGALADRVGIDLIAMISIEAGVRRAHASELFSITQALSASVADLYSGFEQPLLGIVSESAEKAGSADVSQFDDTAPADRGRDWVSPHGSDEEVGVVIPFKGRLQNLD